MGDAGSLVIFHRLQPKCRAIVVIPARNEEDSIARCLRAFERQERIDPDQFEIILLLNNCTDNTAEHARSFSEAFPHLSIHICETELPLDKANIGTVRRMLMDKACERLLSAGNTGGAILTTDADTQVDQQWIARNLEELSQGVDAVGGRIILNTRELRSLRTSIRRRYYWEIAYSLLLAKLESQLDPLPWDPWPRHHQNFCGSLAISAAMYRRVGGVPEVQTLEDIALCQSVLQANGKIRHSPDVKVSTSARLVGRVEVGLSSHLYSFATEDVPKVENVRLSAEKFSAAHAIRRKRGNYSDVVAAMQAVRERWQHEQETPIDVAICELSRMTNSLVQSTFAIHADETKALAGCLPFGIC